MHRVEKFDSSRDFTYENPILSELSRGVLRFSVQIDKVSLELRKGLSYWIVRSSDDYNSTDIKLFDSDFNRFC